MEIKTLNFLNGNPREKLTCVFVLDDNNVELDKLTFYDEDKDVVLAPELAQTIDKLPKFLEYVYNMGKDGDEDETN